MPCFEKNQEDKVVKIRLKNGWRGLVVDGCQEIAAEPEKLCLGFEKTFKAEAHSCVGLKRLNCKAGQIAVVVKKHSGNRGTLNFFRSLSVYSKAFRNFQLGSLLRKKGVAAVRPLAALQKRKYGRLRECIFITEYKNDRISLDDFVHRRITINEDELSAAKRQIAAEIAKLLADLHRVSLWHRDAKVANFLIYKDDENKFKAELVDMDGIKPYRFGRDKCQLRTLWKLTESLSRFSMVKQDDYLRGFGIYCDAAGFDKERRKNIFARCGRMALTKRLLTLAEDAYKS
ncbi:MAG: hypothetical protein GWO86_01495 [Planctomycetes bacterium]|nr:hypothetical protein [Planctomycetota bacterium]